jgi:hypothetical protein
MRRFLYGGCALFFGFTSLFGATIEPGESSKRHKTDYVTNWTAKDTQTYTVSASASGCSFVDSKTKANGGATLKSHSSSGASAEKDIVHTDKPTTSGFGFSVSGVLAGSGDGGEVTWSATLQQRFFWLEASPSNIVKAGTAVTVTAQGDPAESTWTVNNTAWKNGGANPVKASSIILNRNMWDKMGWTPNPVPTGYLFPPAGSYSVAATTTETENARSADITVKIFDISITADGNALKPLDENNRYAYIASSCTMPSLKAKLVPASLPGNVEYSLNITYTRSARNDSDSYSETIRADKEWDINAKMNSAFRGGKAVLTYKYEGISDSVTFYIRGNNPTKATAVSYIKEKTSLWYPQYVAIHESGSSSGSVMKQFNETGTFNSGNSDIRYTPNASSDGGFGIFQLTNPAPSAQQLWSWKANCDEGISRLNSAQAYANNWMNAPVGATGFPSGGQRVQAKNENNGVAVPVPNKTYGNVTFSDGTAKVIEHAVALKRYNGASLGNFCAWDNANGQWKFNENNSLGFNYVARICAEVL